jgi:hypothetical protein
MRNSNNPRKLPAPQARELLATLKARFEKHSERHPEEKWEEIEGKLTRQPAKLVSLLEMEESGGEPDVVGRDPRTGDHLFFDCSAETPKGRTSLCYDRAGLDSRKEHKPANSAMDLAETMGIELLGEDQYRMLQGLGEFDLKTSSWVLTPPDIRTRGGALYGECRYGRVFVGHNGAQSYYGARGFRGSLRV